MTKEELEQKVADLEAENKTLLEENAKIQEQLEASEKEKDEVLPTIKVGKDSYKVLAKSFTFEGKRVTFDELKKDKDLQNALVEKQVGILQKQ